MNGGFMSNGMRALLILVVFLLGTVPSVRLANGEDEAYQNRVPDNWNSSLEGKNEKVYILAWKTYQDKTSRIDACLAIRKLEKGFALEYVWRDASSQNGSWDLLKWRVAGVGPRGTGEWKVSVKLFKNAPTNKEIYDCLNEIQWTFVLEDGVSFVGCGVCEKNWEAAIHEKPSRFFHK